MLLFYFRPRISIRHSCEFESIALSPHTFHGSRRTERDRSKELLRHAFHTARLSFEGKKNVPGCSCCTAALLDSLAIHVILTFLFVKFALLLSGGILVLLILRYEIIHIGLSFRELHLIHTLTSVPVEECFATEHGCEELSHTLEHFLDRCGVAQESHGHFQTLWWNIADSSLYVVWDPLNEVGAVLILDVEHLFIHFLGRHSSSEQ